MLKCTILGCGGSGGVPQIGCECDICASLDFKDKRMRSSVLIECDGVNILIDTSPDLRQQMLTNDIKSIDAVLYTHSHSDHTVGIDDVKFLSKEKKPIDAFMERNTLDVMEKKFPHIFKQVSKWYKPVLSSKVFDIADKIFQIGSVSVSPFYQIHGNIASYGFRVGDIAYSTDCNSIPEKSFEILSEVKVWIVDCLRYHWAPTHSNLEKTLGWIERVKPELAILTHMDHSIKYDEIKKLLPVGVIPACDGMKVLINNKKIDVS